MACSSEGNEQSVLMKESSRDEGDDLGHCSCHSKNLSRYLITGMNRAQDLRMIVRWREKSSLSWREIMLEIDHCDCRNKSMKEK